MPDDRFLVGTSWKMNKRRRDTREWIRVVLERSGKRHALQRFVIPPFTALDVARQALDGSDVLLGAQNVHEAEAGAHTGEISAGMLLDAGCRLCEIGHSERRMHEADTDERVRAKVRRLLATGLVPLICVGDQVAERDAGAHVAAVLRQATMALGGLDEGMQSNCLLAYEPVWAIGEGARAADPAAVADVHAALKSSFPRTRILYGGSVNDSNAAALAVLDGVDGLFVGRAALDPEGFLAILDAASRARAVTS